MASLEIEIRAKWFPAVGGAPAKHVLGPIRCSIAAGHTVALIGPSGCGKTTLLNLIAGLDTMFDGSVRLPPGTRTGYVFQEPRLLPWRTVAQNLALVLDGVADRGERVARLLREVGLAEAAEVYASRLSLGMARRVALARGFIVEPTLLLLDEPFVSLDELRARQLRGLLLDLLARHRTTALFVTHNLREALMLADRILVLTASPALIAADIPVELDRAARRDDEAIDRLRATLPRSLVPSMEDGLESVA
jgi:NitT/TauT family transport system ATP-binding protein